VPILLLLIAVLGVILTVVLLTPISIVMRYRAGRTGGKRGAGLPPSRSSRSAWLCWYG